MKLLVVTVLGMSNTENSEKNIDGFAYKDDFGEINMPLPNLSGDFQISNVSTAISVVRNLNQFDIKEKHIKKAITKIRSEGRLQSITSGKLRKYVCQNNKIIIDGAHNTLAAMAVKKYLKDLGKKRKIFMVLGMMANKEHKKFIKIFKDRVDLIVTLNIPNQENFMEKGKLSKIAKS